MKASIDKDGNLSIDMMSIVESMGERDLRTFAKYAVFQEYLLKGVIEALVKGEMYTTDDEEPSWWFSAETFNAMRLQLLPLLPEIMAEAVRHLERRTRQAVAEANGWRDACWKLQRAWDDKERRPEHREHPYAPPMTKEQAATYLAAAEARIASEAKERSDERLTDEALARLSGPASSTTYFDVPDGIEGELRCAVVRVDDLEAALTELRERRAASLTPEEVEALRWMRRLAEHTHCEHGRDVQIAALAVLKKLLGGGSR